MLCKNLLPLTVLALVACARTPEPAIEQNEPAAALATPPPAPPAPANVQAPTADVQGAATSLTLITDPSTVCMVNDMHMGSAQIPVQVEGKTYYGCCQMCEAKLKQNEQARLGTDPVTQKAVDKATAVLAMDPKGKVLYFETEANMRTYAARM